MKNLIVILSVVLTGCASPPTWLANYYNSQDKCQNYYQVPNYQYPNYCGASKGTVYITRDYNSGRYLTTTKAQ
jgi:starvation-inducible outer membrane lipoprotein